MTKLCSVCATENKDDAQFCRACGTTLATAPTIAAADTDALAAGIVCDECGFQNKPGLRYCANCGVSLLGTVIVPRSKTPQPSAEDPFAGLSASPPPLSYPSFAPVAPYPPAPAAGDGQGWGYRPAAGSDSAYDAHSGHGHDHGHDHGHEHDTHYPPAYDTSLPPPDVPDADLAAAQREHEAFDAPTPYAAAAAAVAPEAKPSRMPLIVGGLLLALLVAGGAGWWFMSRAPAQNPVPVVAPLPAPTALPVTPPPPVEPAAASAAVPAPATSMPLTTVAPGEALVVPGAAASATTGAVPALDPEADAKRIAADKLRREKLARDKAERDARAKAQAEQAAAAARADQEAQARRRAEEAQRQRSTVPQLTTPVPMPAQARGVRELCAGRGTISESICQSRECGAPEHANETICRQIREADERRRNYTN